MLIKTHISKNIGIKKYIMKLFNRGINFYTFFRVRIIIYRTDFVNILLKIIYYKYTKKNNKRVSNSFLNFS
jgi:hypothetical protein